MRDGSACRSTRPGGIFRTVMRSPEGREYPHVGCYLDIVEHQRLVWTTVLGPGFRPPNPANDIEAFAFTAAISFEALGARTRYRALVMHRDEAGRSKQGDGLSQPGGARRWTSSWPW
jgi:uncharacterized protein YndB with AHSA1/START domain